jgi:glucose/arabinose dehydrogenase
MRYLIFCTFTVCLLMNSGCSHAQSTDLQKQAAANYKNYCAGCHGDQLQKFSKSEWMYGSDDSNVIKSIRDGREDTGMPAFRATFNDTELKALAQYVKAGIPADKSILEPADTKGGITRSEVQKFFVDTVVTGLDVPWGLEFLPNGDLLIAERSAKLYRFSNNKLTEISGLPEIMVKGQGGLLDLELHPDYGQNGWLYLSYSGFGENSKREGATHIMRAKIDGNRLTNQEVIFKASPNSESGIHWGCKLEFDQDGYLFFGIGERGALHDNPQTLGNYLGKIHRIHDDGSIPKDNPFVNTPGAMPTIYSYGHRNPQGTCMHPETGVIWETEHGPRGGDELNIIKPGKNYGWPVISYGINYDGTVLTELTAKEGMEQPVTYWVPSIAPCGMTFVKGDRYKNWKNNILVGSLRFAYLERIVLDGSKVTRQEKLLEGIGRVRNVEMSPDGFIYVSVEKPAGIIVRLVPVD